MMMIDSVETIENLRQKFRFSREFYTNHRDAVFIVLLSFEAKDDEDGKEEDDNGRFISGKNTIFDRSYNA